MLHSHSFYIIILQTFFDFANLIPKIALDKTILQMVA